jgi:nitric oxide dioxygenase
MVGDVERVARSIAQGLQCLLLHADVDEGSFALRRQVVSDVLALGNASIHLWYEDGS